ncbi:type VI secretion system-associated lipoprotein [Erwinia sp. OLTSP20]|uniref:type VI secretion system lipoprotein TssJ n=1 Tax=unclassified Erwinia TaxID=2622719 RepID=UPI000C19E745|nr:MULTISPECIES: type VI secretion system lipoprotein TssJ [unclassified Erwinia]PIJ48249.1 type VI secretion system-associated lipoprotein [Erwinia sp. OAMSP11]PIJ68749.1 type VI secretion system-associated lipoprotein [Erwinia sp. OLSSP12]PIJ78924.1 type VI secretion system-associated lipoprotein [Erwinia sp. OLCASP19]PIJ79534.1 type VI secretion system-associated lipoprotein [Erwinia sp. OLMTSP26]PIJ81492.1 type VI secretion system-associated lipoprotein [Erwinia sp. OLMDSP33]
MRAILPFMLLLSIALLSGCTTDDNNAASSEKQAIEQAPTPFAQGAIALDIQTDPNLNAVHGIANSCTLLVIQASKSSTLNNLLNSPPRLRTLFSDAGGGDDILKVDRYSAMPGQRITLHIDRSQNSRYVAIVAGYYPFPQQQHRLLVAIPVISESDGWWNKTWHARLQPLYLRLRLGSDSISQFEGAKPLPLVSNTSNTLPDTPVRPAGGA